MEKINRFHLCKSELNTLINEVDHLENVVVDAMIREQHPNQHVILNQFYADLEIKRTELDNLYNEIRVFESNFNSELQVDLDNLRNHELNVDVVMDTLHKLKEQICNFINSEIDQKSLAS